MLDSRYLIGWFLGGAAGLAISLALGDERTRRIPRVCWWVCLPFGLVCAMYATIRSTDPSFAPRVTVTGAAFDSVEHRDGKESFFSFRLVPQNGQPLQLNTEIAIPGWANPSAFDGRLLQVTYLDDTSRYPSNEAIDILILSGRRTGWRMSRDARPFGIWLGIPEGAFFTCLALFGLRSKRQLPASPDSESILHLTQ